MIYSAEKETVLTFSALPPFYLPFFNRWGANAYYKYEPFSLDPFTLPAISTSGSPVVLAGGKFFGFLKDTDGVFSYDGKHTLSVTVPAGQSLYYDESCDPFAAWQEYNRIVLSDREKPEPQPFWSGLEYCTWVDQKNLAARRGEPDVHKPLTESYVYDYMKRVDRMKLPHGKLTIDDGWDIRDTPGCPHCYGNWEIDREKFPRMERLVRDMTAEGFYPGLWFAPFTVTPNSRFGSAHPELIGGPFPAGGAELEESQRLMYLLPSPVLERYYTDLYETYISMGFRKFKLDMSYGPKQDMKALLRMMYGIIKKIDPSVEVEAHIPDIFVSRYADTVRINDVSFDDAGLWRGVTMEHYRVCRYSAGGKILNLDHIGTNTPEPAEKDFFAHAELLLSLEGGYPCVSLLPDVFGEKAAQRFSEMINDWAARHSAPEKENSR